VVEVHEVIEGDADCSVQADVAPAVQWNITMTLVEILWLGGALDRNSNGDEPLRGPADEGVAGLGHDGAARSEDTPRLRAPRIVDPVEGGDALVKLPNAEPVDDNRGLPESVPLRKGDGREPDVFRPAAPTQMLDPVLAIKLLKALLAEGPSLFGIAGPQEAASCIDRAPTAVFRA